MPLPMLDGWSTCRAPANATTGTGPQKFAITGPSWKGKLPVGLKEYKSPTSMVWVSAASPAPAQR